MSDPEVILLDDNSASDQNQLAPSSSTVQLSPTASVQLTHQDLHIQFASDVLNIPDDVISLDGDLTPIVRRRSRATNQITRTLNDAISPDGNTSVARRSNTTRSASRRSPRTAKRGPDGKIRRVSKVVPKTPQSSDTPASNDENDSGCIICLEPFENYGKHRAASLRCGHVFGESCIHTWLERGGNLKCPHCNSAAKKRDIRVLYCSKLIALDVAEREKTLESLEQEKCHRKRLEYENNELRMKYKVLHKEFEDLRRKIELDRMNSNLTQSNFRNKFYKTMSQLTLSSKGGSRRVVFDAIQKVLVTSQCLDFLSTSQGHGLRKISALDFKTSKMIKAHEDSIKSLAGYDCKILSGGSDKKVSLTCLKSDIVIQSWTVPSFFNIWCCEFDRKDSNYMYVAVQNGSLLVYDARHLSRPVITLSTLTSENRPIPVTSLSYIANDAGSFTSSGLLVGGFDGCRFLEFKASQVEPQIHNLGPQFRGMCTSLSFDAKSSHFLATFRPGPVVKNVRHVVAQLASSSTAIDGSLSRTVKANVVHEFYGGPAMPQLTRSAIYASPTGKCNQLFVAAYDQLSEQMLFWETNEGTKVQTLRMNDFVSLDLCPCEINNEHYLAALSDSSLRVLKYC